MARTDTLTNYLTDVASAIKTKKGDNTPIQASSFDTEIANLPSGANLSEYFVTEITHNTSSGNNYKFITKKNAPFTVANDVTSLKNCFEGIIVNIFDASQMNMSNISNINSMFSGASSIVEIIGLNNWDTSNIINYGALFSGCTNLKSLDCSSFALRTHENLATGQMFYNTYKLATLDISNMELTKVPSSKYLSMFTGCGTQCLQSDGAYADGIPYVYVKNTTQQNWVLTENNGHPTNWSTNNVIVKSN